MSLGLRRIRPRPRRILPAALAAPVAAAVLGIALVPCDLGALDYRDVASVEVVARDGTPLRAVLGPRDTRARWVALRDVSPYLVAATLAAEDRRFRLHPGIDPLSLARAAWSDVCAGRIVRGGSTLTQQLSGLLWPEPRTVGGKLREAARAVRLELVLSKDEILEQYMNRAPYGHGIQGVGLASQSYFGRSAAMLTPAQAAALAALPQAPGRYAGAGSRFLARRNRVLREMAGCGRLAPDQLRSALAEATPLDAGPPAFNAPHFADWVLAGRPPSVLGASRLVTTLDPAVQREAEGVVRAYRERLAPWGVSQAAVVVERIADGSIAAMVGSVDWGDSTEGQVNGATALRQPGSALKPFLYAEAFAEGLSPADLLADLPLHAVDPDGGDVAPRNYDGVYHGPVRARVALASSFNVPAVRVQMRIGTARALATLRAAGLSSFDRPPGAYGLGLTLGVGEVALVDLVNAYAGLARGGVARPVRAITAALDPRGRELPLPAVTGRRWVDPAAAWLVQDVLADAAARVPGFGAASALDLPFPVAVKTGTSTGYRDSWCVGLDGRYVVGVWTGNFDGAPVRGLAGVRSAGPVFRDLMLRLHQDGDPPWPAEPPPGWRRRPVCALSGDRPGPACGATLLEWFRDADYARRPRCAFHRLREGRASVQWPAEYLDWARERGLLAGAGETAGAPRIVSPQEGTVYFRDPALGDAAGVRLAAGPVAAGARWFVDGRAVGSGPEILWSPVPGEHRVELRTPAGTDRVRFTVR